jgi:ABC-type phosphonate transport system ATPase subunit
VTTNLAFLVVHTEASRRRAFRSTWGPSKFVHKVRTRGRRLLGALIGHRLMTIGEACRAMIRESPRTTQTAAVEQVNERNQPVGHVMAQLGLT